MGGMRKKGWETREDMWNDGLFCSAGIWCSLRQRH